MTDGLELKKEFIQKIARSRELGSKYALALTYWNIIKDGEVCESLTQEIKDNAYSSFKRIEDYFVFDREILAEDIANSDVLNQGDLLIQLFKVQKQ